MFFITPILAGIILVGTLGAGTYVTEQAKDVVSKYNLSQIAHILEIYYAQDGKYPEGLDEIVSRGEIKNINTSEYQYFASGDGQKAAVLGAKSFCWSSESGKIGEVSASYLCHQ